MQWFDGTLCYDSHYKLVDYFMQYTFSFLIYSTSIYWVLALCQTLGDKEYHGQKKKKKREREIQKLFFYRVHVLVGKSKTEETVSKILNHLPFYTCYGRIKNLLGNY